MSTLINISRGQWFDLCNRRRVHPVKSPRMSVPLPRGRPQAGSYHELYNSQSTVQKPDKYCVFFTKGNTREPVKPQVDSSDYLKEKHLLNGCVTSAEALASQTSREQSVTKCDTGSHLAGWCLCI